MKKKIEKGSVALKKHTSETEKLKKVIDFTLETCWKKQKNRQNSYQHIKNRFAQKQENYSSTKRHVSVFL